MTLPLFGDPPPHAAAPLADAFAQLPAGWRALVAPFVDSPDCNRLCAFVDGARAAGKTVYPDQPFTALHATAPEDVRVVILGQDPYHGDDHGIPQAHGLAFSVPPGVRPPPSLRNIFRELANEYPGFAPPAAGTLTGWAQQGVLLLNTVLTVERGAAASHAGQGWETLTDLLLAQLARSRSDGIVFILWGAHAQRKAALLGGRHLLLQGPHPSPLSAHRGFFGCGHFRAANDWLIAHGRAPIDWTATRATEP